MKFVDSVKIEVRSGNGGAGITAFRREKFVPLGGPNGGNGGDGGGIIFMGDSQKSTLLDLRFKQHQHAKNGQSGKGKGMHGRNGEDLIVSVPLGTQVKYFDEDEVLVEITEERQYPFLKGGAGGKGNAFFRTSTNKAPDFHEDGKKGEEHWLTLELKIMADVGLVGLPNAGKSTFIRSVSKARPKVADYPFTTLVPQLGVVKELSFDPYVIADIPGIIKGAHLGQGLGFKFLKHIERTKVLLLVIDGSSNDLDEISSVYNTLISELSEFDAGLPEKMRLVAINKLDAIYEDGLLEKIEVFMKQKKERVFFISGVTKAGTQKLTEELAKIIHNLKEGIK